MKKLGLLFLLLTSIFLIACNNTSSNKDSSIMNEEKAKGTKQINGVTLILAEEAEIIEDFEYVNEIQSTYNKIYKKYEDKVGYNDKLTLTNYNAIRSRYGEIAESISNFRTNNEDINKYHDGLIDTILESVKINDNIMSLMKKIDILNEKDSLNGSEKEELSKHESQIEVLKKMYDKNIDKEKNILSKLEEILGIEFKFDFKKDDTINGKEASSVDEKSKSQETSKSNSSSIQEQDEAISLNEAELIAVKQCAIKYGYSADDFIALDARVEGDKYIIVVDPKAAEHPSHTFVEIDMYSGAVLEVRR